MERIKNIEILRIIGCLSIIFLHMFRHRLVGLYPDIHLYHNLSKMTFNGAMAIDLFFILSGVFFVITFKPEISLWQFIKKKIIRLYPVMIFCVGLSFITSLFGLIKFSFYDNLLSLLCFDGIGLTRHGSIHPIWYVDALFVTLALFFYLLKNYEKKNINLFMAVTIYVSYNILRHTDFSNSSTTYFYFLTTGFLRALAGIGVGYFIGNWYKENYQKIKDTVVGIKTKLVLTGLEFACLGFVINNLMLHKLKYNNPIIFVVVFTAIIILFLLNKGYLSQVLNRDIFVNISKYTYSFFLSHMVVINALMGSIWENDKMFVYSHPVYNILICFVLIFILGILTYHLVEKPTTKYLKEKWL